MKTDEDIKSIDGKLCHKISGTAPRNKYSPHPWQLPLPDPLANSNHGNYEHAHRPHSAMSGQSRNSKPEADYQLSVKSDTDSSRYFVLERDSIPTDNTC